MHSPLLILLLMGIFDCLKKWFGDQKEKAVVVQISEETRQKYERILSFNKSFRTLLKQDCYIARSDYKHLIAEFEDLFNFYNTLISSGLLQNYIHENVLKEEEIQYFSETYDSIKDLKKESFLVREHNELYITSHLEREKDFLDSILKESDPTISLDEEQRRVILSDEDYTLVIAGAGAGKTTTVAAKVRYLVEKKKVDPEEILVISFTNKAVSELRERINEQLHIACPITTFHSVGYTILRKAETDGKRVVDGGCMYKVISEYLKGRVLSNTELVEKLIMFFGSYFSAPYEGEDLNGYFKFVAKADFSTLKSHLHEYAQQIIDRKTQQMQTLNNENLRSIEEVRIANFLYMNNIEYEYEPLYQYRILDANKPYTPDFKIWQDGKVTYIEHFGITEDGFNGRYSEEELSRYKSRINDKVLLHRRHKTDLIYTFSVYRDKRDCLEHLQEQLLQKGYRLVKRPAGKVYRKLVDSEESKYITRLALLICTFIGNFKTQGFKVDRFDEFKVKVKNVRTKLFLDICVTCYLEYQKFLRENNCIDFQDMINESAELIRKKRITKELLNFRYIIVDEYQDISRQRYNLIRELSKLCHAKIVAVGDDWQSIYAFSGSILPLFTRFCEEVGYGQELKITKTYRNAQEIIDIAGTFVQKNSSQIKKELVSPKRITNPVIIHTYSEDYVKGEQGGKFYRLGVAVNTAIEEIIKYNKSDGKSSVSSILLIGRYGFDARNLCYSKEFSYDDRAGKVYSSRYGSKVKLQFLTAHSSKGLSAENVIIINAKDEIYGFPSKVDDDPVLNLVISNDCSYNYAEERRLFYVALTRTKNRVFIVTPEKRPSEFIKELLSDTDSYPNVTLKGELKTSLNEVAVVQNKCPVCGYPMQLRWNKNYGLRLWVCTNDQEVCGFMTNDRRGGELSIQKCDWCEDGYLIVKEGRNGYILGCTNYKKDGSGCGRMLNKDHYSAWKKDVFGVEDKSVTKPSYWQNKEKKNEETMLPKMLSEKTMAIKNFSSINKIEYSTSFIEKDGFQVIVDSNGNMITDMELLSKLRALRMRLAKERGLSESCIMHKSDLVMLATDKPMTKEEFLSIYGLGEKIYESYGEEFMEEIKKHVVK